MLKTIGIHPKVAWPVVGQLVAGAILWLIGDDTEGKTLVLTALGTFGIGFSAPAGVTTHVGAEGSE